MAPILVTGAAGFIGFHVARKLLSEGRDVWGLDNLDPYYDVSLKDARLRQLREFDRFRFLEMDLADQAPVETLFRSSEFDAVVNLAAQAGVRYSLANPHAYVRSNVQGFLNVLEGCRHRRTPHLLYASSSSVYGANTGMPFSTHQTTDHPVSLYGATKKTNELFAHTDSHLFRVPTTGLRFFTVYGPWGRPDMAYFLFTRAILAGEPIQVFNDGRMERDFTYIDDVVEAVCRLVGHVPAPDPGWSGEHPDAAASNAPYRLYNIGNHQPVKLLRFIEVLEECLGKKAIKTFMPMQPGDVPSTYADVDDLARAVDFAPRTPIEVGVERFVRWYRDYFKT
ncbi:MAG: NAD-dependent epimerase [Bradyrhizobium sp.]